MTLRIERGADTWTLRLDRPGRANALSADLVEALHAALDEIVDLPGAARPRVLVLRGSDRHFAAGFDLGGLGDETDASLAWRFLRVGVLLERLADAPLVTVAVAEGAAVGAGADLVLACDHRLVADSVTLRFPGSAFGVVLGAGRRAALGDARVTGTPADLDPVLAAVLAAPATGAGSGPPPRPVGDPDTELAALARSVAAPGLRHRLAAYAERALATRTPTDRPLTKEPV